MKISVFLFSFFISFVNFDINEIRDMYKSSHESKENTLLLYDKVQAVTKKDGAVLVAYKGALIAMKGRYEKGAKQKSAEFKSGISLIEYAINQEPNNIEARFVRLTVQQNSPKFLKYKSHIEEDKNFVLTTFKNIKSLKLQNYIGGYILNSSNFTDEEKRVTSLP